MQCKFMFKYLRNGSLKIKKLMSHGSAELEFDDQNGDISDRSICE